MKLKTLFASLTAVAAMTVVGATVASAQSTLEIVKERGHLRCQVGPPGPGFYNLDANGEWYGSDVSICQAVAAAIFGSKSKLEIQSVSTQVRFTALANGESDMLSRTATWTLLRDTQLGLDFTATNFYDGQGFMVPKDSGITSAMDLAGATVCVLTGTTTELNLADFSRVNNLDISPNAIAAAQRHAENDRPHRQKSRPRIRSDDGQDDQGGTDQHQGAPPGVP